MGQEQAIQATDERSRLLAAARAMVLKGEKKFSISRLCGQAGLPRASFSEYFSSRTELMAELMADAADGAPAQTPVEGEYPVEDSGEESGEAPVETFGGHAEEFVETSLETFAGKSDEAPVETPVEAPVEAFVEAPVDVQPAEPAPISVETSAEASVETPVQAPAPAPAAEVLPKAASEPSVSTPDAWLERRLRVFERALSALEAKAVTKEREQARVIAELEEKLSLFQGTASQPRPAVAAEAQPAPAKPTLRKARVTPIEDMIARPEKSPEKSSENPVVIIPAEAAQEESEQPEAAKPAPEKNPALLEVTPARAVSLSREEMAEVVSLARGRAKAAAAAELDAMPPDRSRIRWLAVAGLSLLVLFLFIGLSLGKNSLTSGASAAIADTAQDDGVTPRHRAEGALARMTALADAGDTDAQARLALIYLKGDGVAADPAAALRWARAAAETGQPVAEYLMGVFYREGKVVRADDDAAFTWFSASATKGNLKAMHSLAIAYAQGQGTAKDEKQAAEWFQRAAERGYVDSAFDLALLYERGLGVPQDMKQALTWYGIAAQLGDVPAAERVVALQNQTSRQAAVLAAFAAKNFTPLTPLGGANRL